VLAITLILKKLKVEKKLILNEDEANSFSILAI